MASIGETLRRERLRRNLELDQISQHLKISSRMLAAIEDENFDRLPGGVFSRSFIRQYATFLELDAESIAGRVEQILHPGPEEPRFVQPVRTSVSPIQVPPVENWETVGSLGFSWRSPLTALGMVVVVMLGCAGVYAWWVRNRHPVPVHEQPRQETVAVRSSPVSPTPPAPAPTAPPAPVESQPSAQPPPQPSLAPPQESPAPTAIADTSLPQPQLNPNAPVRVEMTAEEPVWLSVKSDGKYLFSGVLEANQSRTVDANATVLLLIGNAGGVNILLNGKSIGSLGPKGQVCNVQLTSGGFEIVAPKSPEPM